MHKTTHFCTEVTYSQCVNYSVLIFNLRKCAPNFSLGKGKIVSSNCTLLTPDHHMFSDDFRRNRSCLICLNLLNIRNKIWWWSLTKENMRYLVKPEFIYILLYYHCFTCSAPVILPKCKLNSANTPWICAT